MTSANSLILPPFSALYSLATRLRLAAYRRHLFSVSKLAAPVISVGNITTGGTGKTPLVEWVCRIAAAEEKRVCVLTRGYRRRNPKEQVVVSDGEKIFAGVDDAGDEPLLLARNLLGVAAVVCNSNRSAAGEWALENFKSEVFVLDDGFQHLRLARDLNIVTVDATNPWGGGMLPYGRLRESLSGLTRADCIVLTRTEGRIDVESLTLDIRKIIPEIPIFRSRMVSSGFHLLNDRNNQTHTPIPQAAAFCGVGNPRSFFNQVRAEGYELKLERAFPDHYNYQQSDIDRIVTEAKQQGAHSLITTAKDAVKLSTFKFDLPCWIFEINIEIEDEAKLSQLVRNQLKPKVK